MSGTHSGRRPELLDETRDDRSLDHLSRGGHGPAGIDEKRNLTRGEMKNDPGDNPTRGR